MTDPQILIVGAIVLFSFVTISFRGGLTVPPILAGIFAIGCGFLALLMLRSGLEAGSDSPGDMLVAAIAFGAVGIGLLGAAAFGAWRDRDVIADDDEPDAP